MSFLGAFTVFAFTAAAATTGVLFVNCLSSIPRHFAIRSM
jgi:hypothetical protein